MRFLLSIRHYVLPRQRVVMQRPCLPACGAASTATSTFTRSAITVTKAPSSGKGDPSTNNNSVNTNNTKEPQSLFQEPIHILGAGSIGMLWAASIRFTFPSYPVKLLVRNKKGQKDSKKKNDRMTICLRGEMYRSPRIVHVPCESVDSSLSRPIRNLVVTTKAFSAVNAVKSVAHRLTDDNTSTTTTTRIIVLCNGALGVAEELANELILAQQKHCSIHLAVTTHGAYREQSSSDDDDDEEEMRYVVHAGYGNCLLQDLEAMATLWDMAGLNCSSSSKDDNSIQHVMWNKLAANCVINPLSALHHCTNGEIVKVQGFADYYYPAIVSEVARVYIATMKKGFDDTSSSLDLTTVEAEMKQYVDAVIRDTAQNKSSMLQDVLSAPSGAQVQTEIDYLSGYIVRAGALHGIPCPVNEELWHAVQELRGDCT